MQAERVDPKSMDCIINYSDRDFYCAKVVESPPFQVDHDKLHEHFPVETVVEGSLTCIGELLSLTFETDDELRQRGVWSEDVRTLKVKNAVSKELVGYLYLDLYTRQGKSLSHGANWYGLQAGCECDGQWIFPIAVIQCSFRTATSLLSHGNLVDLFHVLGHSMHHLCAKAKLPVFHGTNVEKDFVKVPAELFENLVWEPDVLHKISRHYLTGERVPEALLQPKVESRCANDGFDTMRQVVLARLDHEVHTVAECDAAAEFASLTEELLQVPATPDTNQTASFPFLAGRYCEDGTYYCREWGKSIAADMFSFRFKANGVLNPETWASYRREILEPGGSRDANDSVRAFLGHDFQPGGAVA